MPVVLELGKILGGFFAAIVACALGPAAGCNSRRKASRRLRSAPLLIIGTTSGEPKTSNAVSFIDWTASIPQFVAVFFAVLLPRHNPNLSVCKPNPFDIRSEGGKGWFPSRFSQEG